MSQKTLSYWLKAVIVVVALVGAGIYGWFVPQTVEGFRVSLADSMLPELEHRSTLILVYLLGTGVPCFAALGFAWKIAAEIGRDNSFSRINAKCMKIIAWLALGDVLYYRIGMILIMLLWKQAYLWFFPLFVPTFLLDIAGLAISVCSAALSHLILKAALIREENDMTV